MTELYGVIGDPIVHSLSPVIHNGWIRDYGVAAEYLALQVAEGDFEEAMKTLTDRGGKGFNVTLPHKQAAAEYANDKSELVQTLGAANTLRWSQDRSWEADNTDIGGFQDSLSKLLDGASTAKRVFVLGAGGSARAIVFALHLAGAKITLCNRTISRAEELLDALGLTGHQAMGLAEGLERLSDADLVINTTSAGHQGARFDLPPGDDRLFYDISYGSAAQFMLTGAEEAGWRIADGLGMLVYQAARSFEIWFGIQPDADRALKRCREALELAG